MIDTLLEHPVLTVCLTIWSMLMARIVIYLREKALKEGHPVEARTIPLFFIMIAAGVTPLLFVQFM